VTTTTQINGRTLEPGTEFTVQGQGRYSFKYQHPNGDVTGWGPVGSRHARMRSFRADRVTTVHRKTVAHP